MDLKESLILDFEKIAESLQSDKGLKALNECFGRNGAKCDVEYWYQQFTYSADRSHLENFFLYRSASAFGLYGKIDDADITEPALNYLKQKLLTIAEVEDVKVGNETTITTKQRAFELTLNNGETIFLESDTANSLLFDVGTFIRSLIPKVEKLKSMKKWHMQTYVNAYKLETNGSQNYYNPYKFFYFYTLIQKLNETLNDDQALRQLNYFEERASKTHTLENMIVVPYGYNSKRGMSLKTYTSEIKINDDLKRTLTDFEEMCNDPTFSDEKLYNRLFKKQTREGALASGNLGNLVTKSSVEFLMKHRNTIFDDSLALYDEFVHSP